MVVVKAKPLPLLLSALGFKGSYNRTVGHEKVTEEAVEKHTEQEKKQRLNEKARI